MVKYKLKALALVENRLTALSGHA